MNFSLFSQQAALTSIIKAIKIYSKEKGSNIQYLDSSSEKSWIAD